jgi:hypothetical protein
MTFTPSSASATPGWLILTNKGETKTGSELSALITVQGGDDIPWETSFLVTGLAAQVRCTSAALTSMSLEGGGKLTSGGKFTLTGCTVPTPAGCTVKSKGAATGTIVTNSLKGQLQESGEILIEPSTAGGSLIELIFEGATCLLPTEITESIKGVTWYKDCEGKLKTHLVSHLMEVSTAHGKTMFIGSNTAEHLELTIAGSEFWALGNAAHVGLKWGSMFP